jgi:hypothetical protein
MYRFHSLCLLVAAAATLPACSGSTDPTAPGGPGTAQLSVVNGLATSEGAQFKLDNLAETALPSLGEADALTLSAGAHQLSLVSTGGQMLASANFSVIAGDRRAAVLTGSLTGSVTMSIVRDTISTSPGGGYTSTVGYMLLVNSAPGVGPFDLVIHQVGSDSVYRFGFAFPTNTAAHPPVGYMGVIPDVLFETPFVPAMYLVDLTSPGGTMSLAHTSLSVVTGDHWMVLLTTSIEGDLVLTATKE